MDKEIKELVDYAYAHYSEGGDWVYECYSEEDYRAVLSEVGSVKAAKEMLKDYWTIKQEQYEDINSTVF